MKRLSLPLIMLCAMTGFCFAQSDGKIKFIAFHFTHSKMIPNHKIDIELHNLDDEVVVAVKSVPMNNDRQWRDSRVDTTFTVEMKTFDELAAKVVQLKNIDLTKTFTDGMDGTYCAIEYGDYQNTITYRFWYPVLDTNERGLAFFLELCNELLLVGKFKPEKIM